MKHSEYSAPETRALTFPDNSEPLCISQQGTFEGYEDNAYDW